MGLAVRVVGLGLMTMLAAMAPVAAAVDIPDDLVAMRAVPERRTIAPGSVLWIDLQFDVKPGWHIYWRNPGDSGLPVTANWSLPSGFSAGEIEWPAPERFVTGTFGNYGYGGSVDLLVPIAAPAALATGGSAALAADVSWLVCAEICIPGEVHLTLTLPVAATVAPDPDAVARFAAARRHLPQPAPFETRFATAGDRLHLAIPETAVAGIERAGAAFFPVDGNVIDHAAEPVLRRSASGIELVLARPPGATASPLPATLDGVLVLRGGNGDERVFAISANPRPAAVAPSVAAASVAWWEAVLLAFLGGVILNLMPCVFPILSLKVLGFAGAAARAAQRREAIAYSAGVVASFVALGGALLALRAGGAAVGWGFQLQSPVVVGLLAYLFFALGLSLSGVAEFGGGLIGLGSRFAERSGLAGAFATGVLATIVATPCTAPFMGSALGFALLAPAPLALAIFVALGAGLAAPLAIAMLVPGVRRLLPRPGAWMELLKQLLAFPLYATVAWLVWVLIQEVGPAGSFAALFGLVLVAFAMWVYGRTRLAGPAGRRIGAALAASGALAAVALAATAVPLAGSAAASKAASDGHSGLAYEAFSTARLAALQAEHKPAFVNLTAAWCLTCLVNERNALDGDGVRRAFAEHGVTALKGDWTRQDPEITAFLQKFGRSGVPLYLVIDRAGTPTVLPQILTEAGVLAAIDRL